MNGELAPDQNGQLVQMSGQLASNDERREEMKKILEGFRASARDELDGCELGG